MKHWTFLGRLLRYSPRSFFFAFILQLPRSSLPLLQGIILQQIFDRLGTGSDLTIIWDLIAIFVSVSLARSIAVVSTIVAERYAQFSIMTLLRKNLLEALYKQSSAFDLPFALGDLLNRLSEDTRSIAFFLIWILYAIGLIIETIIALVIMAHISILLTLVTIFPLVAGSCIVGLAGSRIEAAQQKQRQTTGAVTAFLGDILAGVQALQIASAVPNAIKRFSSLSVERQKASLNVNLLTKTILGIFDSGVTSLGIGLLLLLAAQSFQTGHFTVGDFALFTSYLIEITAFTGEFSQTVSLYHQVGVAHQRLEAVCKDAPAGQLTRYGPTYQRGPLPDLPTLVKTSTDHLNSLELRDVTAFYPTSNQGVHHISFTLERGQFLVITGRVGSGKSTLLRSIVGTLPHISGDILWNGSACQVGGILLPPRCAYIPQEAHFFHASLRENIQLGLPANETALDASVYLAALEQDLLRFEAGLDTMLGTQGAKLSGGQRLRVAAARSYIRQPELLLIDDFASAVDNQTEKMMWDRLFACMRTDTLHPNSQWQPTCIAVSHREEVLRQADHILVLKDGYIESEGTFDALLLQSVEMQLLHASDGPQS